MLEMVGAMKPWAGGIWVVMANLVELCVSGIRLEEEY